MLKNPRRSKLLVALAVVSLWSAMGSDAADPTRQPSPVGGRPRASVPWKHPGYDYAPSVIEEGGVRKVWWCGNERLEAFRDYIYYRERVVATGKLSPIRRVLGPRAGKWDSRFTCDPSVVRGSFLNPEDAGVYTYAMYYTGTSSMTGQRNAIGLAFSNNGIRWKRFQNGGKPLISPAGRDLDSELCYGAGQPSAHNGGAAAISLFYMDDSATGWCNDRTFLRASPNGIHFDAPVPVSPFPIQISNRGAHVDPHPADADFALEPSSGLFYAAIGTPGHHDGRFQFGIYRMLAGELMLGQGTWELQAVVDTAATGRRLNDSPAFVTDGSGNLLGPPGEARVYFGTGSRLLSRDIGTARVHLLPSIAPLRRYYNRSVPDHWETTGYVGRGYREEVKGGLGWIYLSPQPGTVPLYSCRSGRDHFISRRRDCERQTRLGIHGWLYRKAPESVETVAIYRCYFRRAREHFSSLSSRCEGQRQIMTLGYALAPGSVPAP